MEATNLCVAMELPNDFISYGRVHIAGRIVRFCMCRDCSTLRLDRDYIWGEGLYTGAIIFGGLIHMGLCTRRIYSGGLNSGRNTDFYPTGDFIISEVLP